MNSPSVILAGGARPIASTMSPLSPTGQKLEALTVICVLPLAHIRNFVALSTLHGTPAFFRIRTASSKVVTPGRMPRKHGGPQGSRERMPKSPALMIAGGVLVGGAGVAVGIGIAVGMADRPIAS